MANLKKSPMEKEGEIVSDTITEIAKKTTKRNNSGAKNTTLNKVDNSRPSLIEETTEYVNEVNKFISEVDEYNNKIKEFISQFRITREQIESQNDVCHQHLCFSTKEILKQGISFLEHISHQLVSEDAEEIVDKVVHFQSKILNFYRGLVGSEEYLSLTRLIKPEVLEKIQKYGIIKQ